MFLSVLSLLQCLKENAIVPYLLDAFLEALAALDDALLVAELRRCEEDFLGALG